MTKKQEQLSSLLLSNYEIHYIFADACGNKFLVFDCLSHSFDLEEWKAIRQAIWEFLPTIDVDDALVLRKIEEDDQSIKIKMHVLEPDGTEADFCGNGARAAGVFLYENYATEKNFFLVSRQGNHGFIYQQDECFFEMGKPILHAEDFIFHFQNESYNLKFVDCIEPHLVTTDFFDADLLTALGHEINRRWKRKFPKGVNVNCLQHVNAETLKVLTFERGVYKVTGSCGTGSLSCTTVAIAKEYVSSESKITIRVLGGELKIFRLNHTFWLGGPVEFSQKELS